MMQARRAAPLTGTLVNDSYDKHRARRIADDALQSSGVLSAKIPMPANENEVDRRNLCMLEDLLRTETARYDNVERYGGRTSTLAPERAEELVLPGGPLVLWLVDIRRHADRPCLGSAWSRRYGNVEHSELYSKIHHELHRRPE